ncbi:hypothetical protein FRC03_011052 [Tulasnella sp. 419]|nr:hypothetical protein FRC03_011052 [Tulasnella sp. 419]
MSNYYSKPSREHLHQEIEALRQELMAEKEDKIRLNTELESLRKFVNVHDKFHGSDVIDVVETINNEVASFARLVADNWTIVGPKGSVRLHRDALAASLPVLVEALEASNPSNRLSRRLLQVALQTYTLSVVHHWILGTACFGLEDEYDAFMRELEVMIRDTESQATYARWRAMTHFQLQNSVIANQPQKIATLIEGMVQGFQGLGACLTGQLPTAEDVDMLREEVDDSIKGIIKRSIQLKEMISVDIVSANFSCLRPTARQFNARQMEMDRGMTEASSEDKVAATIRLGVTSEEKVGREGVEGARYILTLHLKSHVLTEQEVAAIVTEASTEIPTPVAAKSTPPIDSKDSKPRSSKPPTSGRSHHIPRTSSTVDFSQGTRKRTRSTSASSIGSKYGDRPSVDTSTPPANHSSSSASRNRGRTLSTSGPPAHLRDSPDPVERMPETQDGKVEDLNDPPKLRRTPSSSTVTQREIHHSTNKQSSTEARRHHESNERGSAHRKSPTPSSHRHASRERHSETKSPPSSASRVEPLIGRPLLYPSKDRANAQTQNFQGNSALSRLGHFFSRD